MRTEARALIILTVLAVTAGAASAQSVAAAPVPAPSTAPALPVNLAELTKPSSISSTIQLVALLSVLSLAPAILLMVTSFTRIMIVLSLLRQGLGAQQLPPNQVLVGLSLFMTFAVMTPTWTRVNTEALQPYLNNQLDQKTAFERTLVPVRQFMCRQIEQAGNEGDVDVFTDAAKLPRATSWDHVPITALIPAFMLSELKVAFIMGFKIFLPFLLIDLVVSMLLVSGGMMMMPPVLVSLPFKLLLFVLVDGWRLITGTLLGSFGS
ncbi:MAG: flagellar type III secretion system pore protein FliP [Tepidisphaeraceae bacterium]